VNIYTASKFERYAQVREYNRRLRNYGHTITWDWTTTDEFDDDGRPKPGFSDLKRHEYAMLDYAGVHACDLLIFWDHKDANGARWEAGGALWTGKQVWIIDCVAPSIFIVLPQVRLLSGWSEALSLLNPINTLL
jgi:hypothetical protein